MKDKDSGADLRCRTAPLSDFNKEVVELSSMERNTASFTLTRRGVTTRKTFLVLQNTITKQ